MSKRKETYFFLIAAATLPCFALPVHAETLAECMAKGNNVTKIDAIFKKYNIKKDNPCPQQSKFDSSENCKKAARYLEKAAQELETINKERCQNAEKIKATYSADCKQGSCQTQASGLNSEADVLNQREIDKLKEIRLKANDVMQYQGDVLEGAYKVQQENVAKAATADGGAKDDTLQKLSRAGGTNYNTHEQGRTYFRDALSTVSGLVERTRNREITKEDVDQIQTPLAREPAAVAAAAREFDELVARREQDLRTRNTTLSQNASTTSQRASDTSSLNAADLSKTAGLLGTAGQLAQGAASSSTASGAGSDMSSLGGGVTPQYYGDASSPNGGALGGDIASSPGTGKGGGIAGEESRVAAAGGTFIPGNAQKSPIETGGVLAASKAAEVENGPAPGSTLSNAGEKKDSASTGGSKASALREALRARLASGEGAAGTPGAGATGSEVDSSGASLAPGADAKANVVAAGVASLAPFSAGEPAAGGSGVTDLGNSEFSLAGAETDAAVKGMVSEFGFDEGGPMRGLASSGYQQLAPEILAADSSNLFERTRETHQRSLKKGLVINGLRAKL